MLFSSASNAQDLSSWTAYTSVRTINAITIDDADRIWAATNGGVLFIDREGDYDIYTSIDGLSRLDGVTIAYDPIHNRILVGYVNGLIDVLKLENNSTQVLEDIHRSTNFTSKKINDFLVSERSLYVATDFGIVVYNLDGLFVETSFIQIGEMTRGIPVNNVFIKNDSLYVATSEGVGAGSLTKDLSIKTNWEYYDKNNSSLPGEIMTVGHNGQHIVASSRSNNFILENGAWNSNSDFGNKTISKYVITGSGELAAHSANNVFIIDENGATENYPIANTNILTILPFKDEVLLGTANDGIGKLSTESGEVEFIDIPGPYQNNFTALTFDNNKLISASTNKSSGNSALDRVKGYYIFDGNEWLNFNRRTNDVLGSAGFQQTFTSASTEEYYYVGSWGRGVARHHKESNEVFVFDETNSTIRGYVDDDPYYPVISGLQSDSNDDMWLVSRFGDTPLYFQTPGDDDWVPLPKANAVSSADEYYGLFVDSFDKKWISLQNNAGAGNGLLILDTDQDPSNTSDDNSIKLTTDPDNGNLPDNKVNAIIQDKNDEVWIGTGRGIARFVFPELIIESGASERRAQWLINADTSAASRYLLRDVNVSAMAVNAENEKWIGSVNQGIWVLNAEGSEIIKRFTTDNSPLYSNNIVSIAIQEETGEVFIATDLGLISYQDIPRKPRKKMKTLKVYPNPFAYHKNDKIIIDKLSEGTNIKVMGIDGVVVQELSAVGGRVSWDGRDFNGNKLGSGVYYIVAYNNNKSQTGTGKVIIIR